MTKRTIACRVCGKEFVPCNKSSASLGAFNYRSIACSPECGEEYFRRVKEGRSAKRKTFGSPGESKTDVADTVEVVKEISKDGDKTARPPKTGCQPEKDGEKNE